MRRVIYLIRLSLAMVILSLLSATNGFAVDYVIDQIPHWVVPTQYDIHQEIEDGNGTDGTYGMLSDNQVLLGSEKNYKYFHRIRKVTNQSGIDSAAQFTFDFDPTYQNVIFHNVTVYRGEKAMDQLSEQNIKVLYREQELENRIIDGSKTISFTLDDIRVGDVVEYRLTYVESAAHFGNRFYAFTTLSWSSYLDEYRYRLLVPKNRRVFIKNFKTDIKPQERILDKFTEYVWISKDNKPVLFDGDTPGWYISRPVVQISEAEDWAEVMNWNRDFYSMDYDLSVELKDEINAIESSTQDKKQLVWKVSQFVQDQIRYLGIQIGQGSYKPRDPNVVYSKRFGDCKDKSLLMVYMLNELGIDAYPTLVHSDLQDKVSDFLPAPTLFDHVIVNVNLDGEEFWIDSTVNYQGGNLDSHYLFDYRKGMLLKEGQQDLVEIPTHKLNTPYIDVEQDFDARGGFDASALFSVKTTYKNYAADMIRRMNNEYSRAELEKHFINSYANIFPTISKLKDYELVDDLEKNIIVLREFYNIQKFWILDEEYDLNKIEIYPLLIESYVNLDHTANRASPLSVSHPVHIRERMNVLLHTDWSDSEEFTRVEDPAFVYEAKIQIDGAQLSSEFTYRSIKDNVPAEQYSQYVEHTNKAFDYLGFSLYEEVFGGEFWKKTAIGITIFLVFMFVIRKLYKNQPDIAVQYRDDRMYLRYVPYYFANLIFCPKKFFSNRSAIMCVSIYPVVIWLAGFSNTIDRLSTKMDVPGTLAEDAFLGRLADSWPAFWIFVLFVGTLAAFFNFYFGGWLYYIRLKFCGVEDPYADEVRAINVYSFAPYAFMNFVILVIFSVSYENYNHYLQVDDYWPVLFTILWLYGINASYRGARSVFNAPKGRARFWFIVIPILFALLTTAIAIGVYVAAEAS